MNLSAVNSFRAAPCAARRQQGSTRLVVLASVCFLLGAGASAYWLHQAKPAARAEAGGEPIRQLSEATRAVLKRLDAPIEMRFYARLDPASVPDPVKAFAGRVDLLLKAYEREAGGKIKLTLSDTTANFNPDAATADGIKPFNLDKGDACFLGLAVAQGGRRESLPQLAPEWESALESDVTRAISRLLDSAPRGKVAPAKSDPAVLEEIRRLVPNLESVSLEEATGKLREAALKEFSAAVDRADLEAKRAREKFVEAQNGGSESELLAARQRLQQLQADQMERLKQISAKTQAQVEALRQLKSGGK